MHPRRVRAALSFAGHLAGAHGRGSITSPNPLSARLLLAFLLDLADRLGQEIDDRQAQLGVGHLHALVVEVLAYLAENVLVALLGQIRLAHRAYVVLERRAGHPQLGARPFAEKLVPARLGLEPKLLIHSKFLLER